MTPPDRPNPGGVPPQGVPPTGEDETAAQHRGFMGVFTIGVGDVNGGPVGVGNICNPPTKQYIPVYQDSSDIGAFMEEER